MNRSLQGAIQYAGHALPWQIQIPLFLCIFVAVGTFCSIPSETFPSGFTVNQALEDFGVFLLFTALWAGIYAHFRRDINIFWLLALFAAALVQEEINVWNKLLFALGDTFGYEMTSRERQRGDVFMLALIAVTLLVRLVLDRRFKSFMRLHITFFLFAFVSFQLMIHFVFAYNLQGAVIEQRQKYLQEVVATYTDRFDYLCQQDHLMGFEFSDKPDAEVLKVAPSVVDVLNKSKDSPLYVTSWLEVAKPSGEIFRGVDANAKVLVALYHEGSENRMVVDTEFPITLHKIISTSLLTFATPFGLVWFFGGMHLVLFHQARVYRMKYGSLFRKSLPTSPAIPA